MHAEDQRWELRHFDLTALSSMLRICRLDAVLLGTGDPQASLGFAMRDGMLCVAARYGFAFRASFSLPEDWCLLGCVHRTPPGSWYHGRPLQPGSLLTAFPGGSTELLFQPGLAWSILLLPLAQLHGRFHWLGGSCLSLPDRLSLFVPGERVSGEELTRRYVWLHRALLEGGPGEALAATAAEIVQTHLQAGLTASPQECPRWSRARRTHYLAFRRAESFMRDNLRQDIYISNLCNAASASERALRYAFQDLLGLSPNRYLSMLRLCAACRALLQADARRRSVKSIALGCGLWDLSRFAGQYRRVFGESPRDTLIRDEAETGSSGGVDLPYAT
jgi:AraC family ethanolamine operon transcriptional activator